MLSMEIALRNGNGNALSMEIAHYTTGADQYMPDSTSTQTLFREETTQVYYTMYTKDDYSQ